MRGSALFWLGMALGAAQDKEIEKLLEDLRSDEIEIRESARRKLVAHGVRALDVLGKTPLPADAEVASRLRDVAAWIVEDRVRAEWTERVTLDLKDAPVRGALDALRRQTKIRIELEDTNVPDDLSIDALKVSEVPFSRALDEILVNAHLSILHQNGEAVRIGRIPSLTFNFKEVNADVLMKMIERLIGVTIRRDPEIKGALDYACENRAWTKVLDDVCVRLNWVAVRLSEKEVRVRRRADFEKDLKTRSFALKHLQPENPVKGRRGRFPDLLWSLEEKLSRGAGWETRLGKVAYDPWQRTIVVTDREEILTEAAKLIAAADRGE